MNEEAVVVVEVGVASEGSADFDTEVVRTVDANDAEEVAAVDDVTTLFAGGNPNLNPLLTVDEAAAVVTLVAVDVTADDTKVDDVTTRFSSEEVSLGLANEKVVEVAAAVVVTVVVSADEPNPNLKPLPVTSGTAGSPNLNDLFADVVATAETLNLNPLDDTGAG